MATAEARTPGPWIARLGVPVVAVVLLAVVRAGGLDEPVLRALNGLASERSAWFWAHVTLLGEGLVALLLVFLFGARKPDLLWQALLVGLLLTSVTNATKSILRAPRPVRVLGVEEVELIGPRRTSRSFPSGHAGTAFGLAGLLVLRWRQSRRGASHDAARTAGVLVGASVVAASRLVVGAHWPDDVLAGAALGWLCAVAGTALARRWSWGRRRPGDRVVGVLLLAAAVSLATRDLEIPVVRPAQYALAAAAILVGAPLWWTGLRRRERAGRGTPTTASAGRSP